MMLAVLANGTYRRLLAAQIIALLGAGLATVALGLLAYDLAGPDAGAVLGTALTIKMIAYVAIAPVATALAAKIPRRPLLVSLDVIRAAIAATLPFVTEIWQIYLLVFLLQSASAAFTPAFQATIPDVLPDEKDYTRALSLSRLAYDVESLVSPLIAAALLSVIGFHDLFGGTMLGFLASAALVVSVKLPGPAPGSQRGFVERATRGTKIYLATPRLRGLLAINLAVAAAGALVIVNTVVFVQAVMGLGARETAIALAAFGGGSMLVALALPRLLDHMSDRKVMIAGAIVLASSAFLAASVLRFEWLLALWFVLGAGYSLAQTPSGRLLRRSSHPEDRPAVFAAQFMLSHLCWLVAYPVAGWVGAELGLAAAAYALALLAALSVALAAWLWPASDPVEVEHGHADLPPDHHHLDEGERLSATEHVHPLVIDDLHPAWPARRL